VHMCVCCDVFVCVCVFPCGVSRMCLFSIYERGGGREYVLSACTCTNMLTYATAQCIGIRSEENASDSATLSGNASKIETAIVYEGEEKVLVELLDAWKPYTWPKPDNISSPLGLFA